MAELRFPVSIRWRGGHLVRADAHGREPLELATPTTSRGGLPGYWSPEDLLVAATASSFALTLGAVADRRGAPLLDATIDASGRLSPRDDGHSSFTSIEIDALLETVPGGEAAVADVAAESMRRCLITRTLDVPVHVAVQIRAVDLDSRPKVTA